MTMRIIVRKEPTLKHFVRTRFNARDQVSRTEGDLLNLGEIVGWVPIQDEFAHWNQWEFFVRPYLCEVKWVEFEQLSLFECHDLNVPMKSQVMKLNKYQHYALA